MNAPLFSWDRAKGRANLRTHGVSFEDASSVFRDPLAQVLPDSLHDEQEQRALLIGRSASGRLLLIVFTETGDRIRIISAREASVRERREYEEHS
jgi:uncharacterized protein